MSGISAENMITDLKLSTERLNLYFSEKHVLKDINIGIPQNKITALIGPSGCGKTSLIRTFNRMHDLLDYAKITGKVMIDDTNIYDPKVSATQIRKRIGMVFQKANPFPKNIYDNIAYGLKINNTDPRRIPEQRASPKGATARTTSKSASRASPAV